MVRNTFQCPHCGTQYDVKTERAPYDPNDHSAQCEDCGRVMSSWYMDVRPIYTKRLNGFPEVV